MKRLLIAIGLLFSLPTFAALALWLYGQRAQAGHNGAAIEIARPAASVWPYMTEVQHLKKWNAGVEEVSPPNAPLAKGTRTTVLARGSPDETPLSMEQVITLVDAPKRFAFTLSALQQGMGFEQQVEYRLEERNGGTRVSILGQSTFKGLIKLLEPIITASAQEKLENDLRRLKATVESETAPSAMPPVPVADPSPEEHEAPAPEVVPAGGEAPAAEVEPAAAEPAPEPAPEPSVEEPAAEPSPAEPATEEPSPQEPAAAESEAAAPAP